MGSYGLRVVRRRFVSEAIARVLDLPGSSLNPLVLIESKVANLAWQD